MITKCSNCAGPIGKFVYGVNRDFCCPACRIAGAARMVPPLLGEELEKARRVTIKTTEEQLTEAKEKIEHLENKILTIDCIAEAFRNRAEVNAAGKQGLSLIQGILSHD
jgi:hypothetical protein